MRTFLLLALLAISTSMFAQKKSTTVEQDLQSIQKEYTETKRAMLDEFMGLQGDQATAFWAVYDEYESERQALAKRKFDLLVDYASNYQSLTADKADELVEATFDTNIAYEKLNQKYYGKAKKEIGAVEAARFIQFEAYLQGIIQSEIQDELPFIGEMDTKKKK